ncbi:hypothetical protein [Alicyclobacillus sp. ALC3]|uniref:hypothetical protein n=1 Tax=Alicyclobacillus sp. ALC3 TaxID=2796143 RepID=UPI002379713B|nr:hypothetical protein [Alicyclobacillus sp. ALC3]WDL96409.1 hypothetical protein JC200_19100 [Alicyclobacillus sp. ALC3]
MPVADLRDQEVTLAGRSFMVRIVPMSRVRRLADVIAGAVTELQATEMKGDEENVKVLMDKLLQFPHRLLSLFINKLPEEIFLDEDEGVTFPEFWHALEVALAINRVDALKNVFSRLAPLISQASTSLRTNS